MIRRQGLPVALESEMNAVSAGSSIGWVSADISRRRAGRGQRTRCAHGDLQAGVARAGGGRWTQRRARPGAPPPIRQILPTLTRIPDGRSVRRAERSEPTTTSREARDVRSGHPGQDVEPGSAAGRRRSVDAGPGARRDRLARLDRRSHRGRPVHRGGPVRVRGGGPPQQRAARAGPVVGRD